MKKIESEIFDLGYKESLKTIFEHGQEVNPRGLKTLELSPFVFSLKNPRTRIITNKSRNINLGFNIVEFLSIIGGDNRVETISFLNKSISKYSDDGMYFRGAYGPRLRTRNYVDQFRLVIDKLKSDKDSRQAIMTIFDPYLDYVETKDVPCTISFHFLIRNNKLNMNTYMRSNDAILGHVIDVFTFTMIQEVIANELNIELGEYNHFVGSFHLYENDFKKAEKIINDNEIIELEMPLMEGGLHNAEECYFIYTNMLKFTMYIYDEVRNEYWNDLLNIIKLQKTKIQKNDIKYLKSEIYKKYFERKINA